MSHKTDIDIELVKSLYLKDRKSLEHISNIVGVSRPTLKKRLIECGVVINSHPQSKPFDGSYDTLYDLCVIQRKTLKEMRDILNGDLEKIRKKCHEHGLFELVKNLPPNIPVSKNALCDLYVNQKLLVSDISKMFGVSWYIIQTWLKEYDITERTHAEAMESRRMPEDEFIRKCHEKHSNKYDYSDMSYSHVRSGEHIAIVCPTHGHFRQLPSNHLHGGGCPKCGNLLSVAEDEICVFLDGLGVEHAQSCRGILDGQFEMDIYTPEFGVGIEYDGLYWHCDKFKDEEYHKKKTELAERSGVLLLHIFENEWYQNKDVWKSILREKLGVSESVNTEARQISSSMCDRFLRENCLERVRGSDICYGAFDGDGLRAVMSFKNHGDIWEISNFASTIKWGYDDILKSFLREHSPSKIISHTNRRYSNGEEFILLGFDFVKHTPPTGFYFKGKDWNLCDYYVEGYNRIWDCGGSYWCWSEGNVSTTRPPNYKTITAPDHHIQPKKAGNKKFVISEEDLRELYYNQQMSLEAIGDKFGVTRYVINAWMGSYGIGARTSEQRYKIVAEKLKKSNKIPPPSKECLEDLYITQRKTLSDVAVHHGVSRETVRTWLKDFKIPLRTRSDSAKDIMKKLKRLNNIEPPPKDELEISYKREGTIVGVSKFYGVGVETVRVWMKEYNLKTLPKPKIEIPTRNDIVKVYKDVKTISKLGSHFDVSATTVKRWMADHDIPVARIVRIPPPSKGELENMYIKQKKTLSAIAIHCTTSRETVRKWLVSFKIPLRTRSESAKNTSLDKKEPSAFTEGS